VRVCVRACEAACALENVSVRACACVCVCVCDNMCLSPCVTKYRAQQSHSLAPPWPTNSQGHLVKVGGGNLRNYELIFCLILPFYFFFF
jgi:hypothetical protein